jgi:predicted dinucleotide-binding enzyme
MRIGIVGAGGIGGNCATQFAKGWHEVKLSGVMEAPRRPGAVYGEEYRLPDAEKVVDAVRAGQEIPTPPRYS